MLFRKATKISSGPPNRRAVRCEAWFCRSFSTGAYAVSSKSVRRRSATNDLIRRRVVADRLRKHKSFRDCGTQIRHASNSWKFAGACASWWERTASWFCLRRRGSRQCCEPVRSIKVLLDPFAVDSPDSCAEIIRYVCLQLSNPSSATTTVAAELKCWLKPATPCWRIGWRSRTRT